MKRFLGLMIVACLVALSGTFALAQDAEPAPAPAEETQPPAADEAAAETTEAPAAESAADEAEAPAAEEAPTAEETPAAEPADDETPTPETTETPAAEPAPAAGPKAAAFATLFADWKKILTELRDIKYVEYPEAGVDRKVELKQRYEELIAQGEKMQPELVAAAIEAYQEAPNADQDIAHFLIGIVAWDVQNDDYEKALETAKMLIDNEVEEAAINAFAGEAAFSTNQFDLAEKYFNIAKTAGALAALSEEHTPHPESVGYYKLEWEKEKAIREAEAKADDLPRVSIKTQHGEIIIELFENEAPNTVANFITLVKQGFYDGLTFHRVLPRFMAQGGCPDGNGSGGPGHEIACECVRDDHRKHFRGTLSMAHAGPDTGGSQFFLTFVPTRFLDGRHTAFGRVIEGLDQLAKIQRRDPEDPDAGDAEKIIEMKVIRDRGHEYTVEKMPK